MSLDPLSISTETLRANGFLIDFLCSDSRDNSLLLPLNTKGD